MKTNLNNIWQKCTWQNLQQNCVQQMWDLFVERRYFKFQNDIQFNNGTIETSRFRQLLWLQYELLLPNLASYYLHNRSLLMSRRNIIFYFFSLTYLIRWAPNVCAPPQCKMCAALPGTRRRFHVNVGFSDDDRILAVTSNICCNIATGTCHI